MIVEKGLCCPSLHTYNSHGTSRIPMLSKNKTKHLPGLNKFPIIYLSDSHSTHQNISSWIPQITDWKWVGKKERKKKREKRKKGAKENKGSKKQRGGGRDMESARGHVGGLRLCRPLPHPTMLRMSPCLSLLPSILWVESTFHSFPFMHCNSTCPFFSPALLEEYSTWLKLWTIIHLWGTKKCMDS